MDLSNTKLESTFIYVLKNFLLNIEIVTNTNLFMLQLSMLWMQFSVYFKDLEVEGLKWIQNPFVNPLSRLSTSEQEQLIDLSSDDLF